MIERKLVKFNIITPEQRNKANLQVKIKIRKLKKIVPINVSRLVHMVLGDISLLTLTLLGSLEIRLTQVIKCNAGRVTLIKHQTLQTTSFFVLLFRKF